MSGKTDEGDEGNSEKIAEDENIHIYGAKKSTTLRSTPWGQSLLMEC